jgi:hypothetical protein
MQDTSEIQGALLHAVFPRTSPDVVVQRVGDPNQALFFDFDAKPDRSDPFPDPVPARCLDIPNSYRFGPELAGLASPFAVRPAGPDGLCGIGPRKIVGAPSRSPHAVFIFPDGNTAGVLDAFGGHVLATFTDGALADGAVVAVGAVHQGAPDVAPGDPKFPKAVPHYWSAYKAELSGKEPHPRSLVQYVRVAQAVTTVGRDLAPGVERIASGLLRTVDLVGEPNHVRRYKKGAHRAIEGALAGDANASAVYRHLLKQLLVDRVPVTEAGWPALLQSILALGNAVCNRTADAAKAAAFFAWQRDDLSPAANSHQPSSSDAGPNIYRATSGARHIDIRLGSIHSVKGQSHLATMLLSTYWHDHSAIRMSPWLLGTKVNGTGAGDRDRRRLLQTYVAMTRPTHLICLAVPRSTFGDDETYADDIATLKARGWCVGEIVDGAAVWNAWH